MASAPPPKPWEVKGGVTTSASDASPGPKPWEQPGSGSAAAATTANGPAPRPWEQPTASTSYLGTGYGASSPYSSAYGNSYSTPYGSSYSSPYSRPGLYGSTYGSSMYGGGSMYGGYGGGMYGSSGMYGGGGLYGSSMYGGAGSMYGGGMYGRPMFGGGGMYGGGMYGAQPGMGMAGPYGPEGGPPPAPPSAWQALLGGINGIMHFFGRLSFLVDENAHAVHFFISALLQLLDRAGSLYGEVARFILRVLFRRQRAIKGVPPLPGLPPGAAAGGAAGQQQQLQRPGLRPAPLALPGIPVSSSSSGLGPAGLLAKGPMELPSGSHWDNLWSES